MKKYALAVVVGGILAMIVVMAVTPGSWTYYRFNAGLYDVAGETEEIGASIRKFGAVMGGFYSGGDPEELNTFPAVNTVKRRIFMDLNLFRMLGKVFVMDRDTRTLRDLKFVSPVHAVVTTDENWFVMTQDARTRRPLSEKKADKVAIRYYLKKLWGQWLVADFDVYVQDDVPEALPAEKTIPW